MNQKTTFSELINSEVPVLIDFSAAWCGPCKAMGPILSEVASTIGDQAKIVKVDVDANPALAQQLNIQGVPTFILYRNGEIRWRQSGMQSAHMLTEVIRQNLS